MHTLISLMKELGYKECWRGDGNIDYTKGSIRICIDYEKSTFIVQTCMFMPHDSYTVSSCKRKLTDIAGFRQITEEILTIKGESWITS